MSTASPPAAPTPTPAEPPIPSAGMRAIWTRAALFVAIVGALGSFYMSSNEARPLVACPLCLYQRALMVAAMVVLMFGQTLPRLPLPTVSTLAMTPAAMGLTLAIRQTWAVYQGNLDCPVGLSGFMWAPLEALIVWLILVGLLIVDLWQEKHYLAYGGAALALGIALQVPLVNSAPPPCALEAGKEGCQKPQKENSP